MTTEADQREHVAAGVATALLAGPWTPRLMSRRTTVALGRHRAPAWLTALIGEVAAAYRDAPVDRPRELAAYLRATTAWRQAWDDPVPPRIVVWTPVPTTLTTRPWPITELPDLAALARLLDVDQGELAWFADVRGLERRCAEPLRHYTWTTRAKRGGGTRLVAAPKPRLKEIQRRLLRHLLAPIPVHEAAHGGVAGRSVRTAVQPHAGADVVLRFDLQAFFASVPAARVWGLLRTAGLPEAVAHAVTGLLTTVAPLVVSHDPALAVAHLPQGAPTSPQLANVVAFRLDRRLAGLAAAHGGQYTRYVDDLTFSGGAVGRCGALIASIVRDEGFTLNDRKTAALRSARRQQVLGAVINVHPAVPRAERDALRATLHNCVVHGWASQARGRSPQELREHLLGRVAWVGALRPEHGLRLRALADRIDWSR